METNTTRALRIIHDAQLGHPDLPLVESFLYDAIDGDQAALYLLRTCANDTAGTKLCQFVEDWKALVKQSECSSLELGAEKRLTCRKSMLKILLQTIWMPP